MKNIFKIGLLALFMGTVSCEDATDIIQESELSEEIAYQTVGDLQTGLNGVYAAYQPDAGTNGLGDILVFNDLFTDNIKRGESNSGQGSQEYGFLILPSTDFPVRIWGNRYATINFANRVLRNIDRVVENSPESDTQAANSIKGQLLALRALSHFDLLQYFTEDYENREGLGIIIMDFVPEIDQLFQRNTVGECFDFIKQDLIEAQELMGNFVATGGSSDVFYINANTIKAIRARVALFEGDYTTAETLAEELVEEYELATPNQYQELFGSIDKPLVAEDGQGLVENIFTLARVSILDDNAVVNQWYANDASASGAPFYEMSNQLYNLFNDSDVRKLIAVGEESQPDNNLILIGKYPGGVISDRLNHIKLIRSSEMLLIKAEAEARNGNLVEAAQSIKMLTDARYFANDPAEPNFANTNEALIRILEERRLELCFEGHRFLDLKRIGPDVGVGINRNALDCASYAAPCELPATDYRFTMPIPNTELNANPTITQNPNY